MSANQSENPDTQRPANDKDDTAKTSESTPLALPAPQDASTSINADGEVSQTFKLDALGPLVINSDGTLSRIDNWAQMTELERERTLRILGKRNQLRRENIEKGESGPANSATEEGKS
ncbi:hypothetical protein AYO21_09001 [Fonsecaea monophora]|uniref:Uncharacterized protein n=1 Tax=Fonsecaea monophora TaxID=254056 RepID=A0A177EXZ3_9EURO|nr:hypothetical protein AYO21_09001 [Fonsecaea monophora]KAH0842650.1 hypothetical protein FOPE_07733 [Fonsecaea pedrosoi]OAG36828.1 hypothetical protein AYO21_09001 [Fonsecaea monophora]